ncbi:hypothetical protein F4818DRAFT_414075 [Hypoxylon cercidicola]|nr:hypothetical protein F4818DRAFT_414075 [Hypoxylon cercidicola]
MSANYNSRHLNQRNQQRQQAEADPGTQQNIEELPNHNMPPPNQHPANTSRSHIGNRIPPISVPRPSVGSFSAQPQPPSPQDLQFEINRQLRLIPENPDYEHLFPGPMRDWQQSGECEALVTRYREALAEDLRTNGDWHLWDFAEMGEWPRELFRIGCSRAPYKIILYATKLTEEAYINPRDEPFWEELRAVARLGVWGGLRAIPREIRAGHQRIAVRFLRTRDLAPDDDEMRHSQAVSDREYWAPILEGPEYRTSR